MSQRRLVTTMVVFIALSVGAIAATFALGNKPLLGLDLQGGVSVVLQPTESANEDKLNEAARIIRLRIDSLGVAEPDVSVRSGNILVQIPGVEDPNRVLDLVGETAVLRFRPVLQAFTLDQLNAASTTTTTVPGATTTTVAGATTTTAAGATTTAGPSTTVAGGTTQQGLGRPRGGTPGESAAASGSVAARHDDGRLSQTAAPTTTAPTPTTTAPTPTTTTPGATSQKPIDPRKLTSRADDKEGAVVVLAETDDQGKEIQRYILGPTALTGDALKSARASLDAQGQWLVLPQFKGGSKGIGKLNAIAAVCYGKQQACPSGQLAIVLDGDVVSAPSINDPSFENGVQISGKFTEREAKDLALVLKFGALPVELKAEAAQVVSATIGKDALHAGVMAGLIGLALASIYMVLYYRLLGVVALVSLALAASLLWAIIAYLGASRGLALTLSGVTGIIVSIGVSLDSNVVYYEHLKEDIRNGRSLRSSVERSFGVAFSTIVKADVASLIGASLLYLLTIGSVRGFALYLGIATVLDLLAAYFFMRPATILLGRWSVAEARPGILGLPRRPEPVSDAVAATPAGAS